MWSGANRGEFLVKKGKTKVGKAKVERITLINKRNPKGVRYYLYQRNGNVTLAIGNSGATITDITLNESVNESKKPIRRGFYGWLHNNYNDFLDSSNMVNTTQAVEEYLDEMDIDDKYLDELNRWAIDWVELYKNKYDLNESVNESLSNDVLKHAMELGKKVDIDGVTTIKRALEGGKFSHKSKMIRNKGKYGYIEHLLYINDRESINISKKLWDVVDLEDKTDDYFYRMMGKYSNFMKGNKIDYDAYRRSKLNNRNLKESNDTYFKTAAAAVQHARIKAEKRGYEIDEDDWFTQITTGGRYGRLRPSVDKYHSFSIGLLKNGRPQKAALQISLYGMPSGNYELTHYIR